MSEEEILALMKEIDPKCSGETDFQGFLNLMKRRLSDGPELDEELYEAFKSLDKRGRGCFDIHEMKEMMEKYGEKMTDDDAEKLFKDIDTDHDGMVSFEDFVLMMMAK